MEGAVGQARGALQASQWKHTEELLAVIAELIHENTRAFVVVNSKKGGRPPEPLKITRPYQQSIKKARRKATSEDLVKMFGGRVRHVPTGETVERAE
jgi:hypothetical protein